MINIAKPLIGEEEKRASGPHAIVFQGLSKETDRSHSY